MPEIALKTSELAETWSGIVSFRIAAFVNASSGLIVNVYSTFYSFIVRLLAYSYTFFILFGLATKKRPLSMVSIAPLCASRMRIVNESVGRVDEGLTTVERVRKMKTNYCI